MFTPTLAIVYEKVMNFYALESRMDTQVDIQGGPRNWHTFLYALTSYNFYNSTLKKIKINNRKQGVITVICGSIYIIC